jgi:hypothetical protein
VICAPIVPQPQSASPHILPGHGDHGLIRARRRMVLRQRVGRRKRHGKGVLYVGHSKNETSKREIPLNRAAREVFTRCSTAATNSATTEPVHYIWCASQHHYYDPPQTGGE